MNILRHNKKLLTVTEWSQQTQSKRAGRILFQQNTPHCFTEWSDAKLIRGKTALTVATFLYELMCRHGCFKVQINDEVREFVSVLCTCLRDLNGVDQCKVYPQYTLNRPYSQYTIRNQMILWRGKTKRQKMPW